MPNNSFPFPTYSGLLEPQHYKNISTAIWLFLWCISSTTKEVEKDGIVWGIVLGNKPMKLSEISQKFGVNDKTVSRWLDTLEQHEYIRVTRAPHGLIITVKNSKKFSSDKTDKNVRSLENGQTEMSDHPPTDKTNLSDHLGSDQTEMSDHPDKNVRSNKDITKIYNTAAINTGSEFEEVMQAFCRIHGKLDIHVKALDITMMHEMIALGVPTTLIIRVMETIFRDRGGKIHSFSYYKDAILEAWEAEKAITTPSPQGTVALGQPPSHHGYRSKQQQQLDELMKIIAEEERHEQSRSG